MKVFIGAVIAIVFATIITGFFVVGFPKDTRLKKFDDIRTQHLQMIQSEIINYWQAKARLPDTLADLNDSLRGFLVPVDPLNGASYEYTKKEVNVFTLCATFAGPSEGEEAGYPKYVPRPAYLDGSRYPLLNGGFNWDHGAGRVCFERTIDPDFFPAVDGTPPEGGGRPPKAE